MYKYNVLKHIMRIHLQKNCKLFLHIYHTR